MTRIWERLYVGNLKDAEQVADANPMGIAAVISLCAEAPGAHGKQLSYTSIPIDDSGPVSARKFEAVMSAIATAVRRGKVLVHCGAGMSRSPILLAAWLHRCGYADFDTALREISEAREIDPSPILLQSVYDHLRR
jgi:atypical dual specificity phosphatase